MGEMKVPIVFGSGLLVLLLLTAGLRYWNGEPVSPWMLGFAGALAVLVVRCIGKARKN